MKKIGSKILLAVLLNTLIIAVGLGGISFYTMYQSNVNRINQMEAQLRSSYDSTVKTQVEIVISELDGIVNQVNDGVITRAESQKIAADIIRNAKYGESGYFWADDFEGNNVVLLGREDVEGKNRIDLQDKTGQYIIKDLVNIAKSGGGYYDYYFPKAGEDEALPKRAYIESYEPFEWAIGTGNYIDDIDVIVAEEKALASVQFKKSIGLMSIILAIAVVVGYAISYSLSRTITKPIIVLTELINRTANLDIKDDPSFDYILEYKDETGIISNAVAELRTTLRQIITELKTDSGVLDNSSSILSEIVDAGKEGINGVSQAVTEFADGAQEQANDAQTAVEKMAVLAQEISEGVERSERLVTNADEVNRRNQTGVKLVKELNDKFEVTRVSTDQLNTNVANLSQSSSQIGDITETIQSIAQQTNLLALNAAIEAARAGDAGKGFAVVADEIRKLAEQTTQSTTQIEEIVGEITSEIDVTMNNMTYSKEAVADSSKVVKDVQESFEAIEGAMELTFEELELLITNISNVDVNKNDAVQAIQGISAITEENAAGAEEISATMDTQNELMIDITGKSDELSQVASKLNEIVDQFKV